MISKQSTKSAEAHMDSGSFIPRHIGPSDAEQREMLHALGFGSLDAMIDATVPDSIRLRRPLAIHGGLSEYEALASLRAIAKRNEVRRSYLGLGYNDCITPPVIQRNVLENPGWYTAYTPIRQRSRRGVWRRCSTSRRWSWI